MLALKKKREAEKKEKEEAAKKEAAAAAEAPPETAPLDGGGGGGQVSLFGIGGQKKTKKGDAPGIKKSPGEIRIQKGKYRIPIGTLLMIRTDKF